jgi:hypothetical protein
MSYSEKEKRGYVLINKHEKVSLEEKIENLEKVLKAEFPILKRDAARVVFRKKIGRELGGVSWIHINRLVLEYDLDFSDFLRVFGDCLVKLSVVKKALDRYKRCAAVASAIAIYVHQIVGDKPNTFLKSRKGIILRSIHAACFNGLLRGILGRTHKKAPKKFKVQFMYARIDTWHGSLQNLIKSDDLGVEVRVSCGKTYHAPGTPERNDLERDASMENYELENGLVFSEQDKDVFQEPQNKSGLFSFSNILDTLYIFFKCYF